MTARVLVLCNVIERLVRQTHVVIISAVRITGKGQFHASARTTTHPNGDMTPGKYICEIAPPPDPASNFTVEHFVM